MNWSWILPESFSTFGPDIDGIYYLILAITATVFFLTEGVLIYFMWRYRHKEGRTAEPIHGNSRMEIIWTSATVLILVGVLIPSARVWNQVKMQVPDGALEVIVTAKQFEWNVTYAGADGALGTADDFDRRAQLHVPVSTPILVRLRAEDVLHSFFLPEMRVKQDAIPGKEIEVWFEPTQPGDYVIGCAELCGLGHYRMQGRLTVHSEADYQAWLQGAITEAAEQQDGGQE